MQEPILRNESHASDFFIFILFLFFYHIPCFWFTVPKMWSLLENSDVKKMPGADLCGVEDQFELPKLYS